MSNEDIKETEVNGEDETVKTENKEVVKENTVKEEIKEIVLDTGLVKFALRDSVTKELYGVISFNPTDFNILKRFDEARKNIEKAKLSINKDIDLNSEGKPVSDSEDVMTMVDKLSKLICEQIDFIFNSEISKSVFGNTSPLAMIKGKLFFENFINAVYPVIEKQIKDAMEKTEKKVSKYTGKYGKKR